MSRNSLRIDICPENKPRGDPFPKEEILSNGRKYFFTNIKKGEKLSLFGNCPVLSSFYRAYAHHYPISISPDLIWLLILQAFSHHVNNNSERLRSKFVNFEGKKTLSISLPKVYIGELTPEDYVSITDGLNEQIGENVGKKLVENLTADFTTTTYDEKIVSKMSIMSTFKCYFDYEVSLCGCGFPYIELEGEKKDWESIKTKLSELTQYEFGNFTTNINIILDKIIETKQGKIDKEFWEMILFNKKAESFGFSGISEGTVEFVCGWILLFCPYDEDEQLIGNSGKIKPEKLNSLASQLLQVPFVIVEELNNKKRYDMVFEAGIIGIEQDEKSFLVKPKIGWCVYEKKIEAISPEELKQMRQFLLKEFEESHLSLISDDVLKEIMMRHPGNIREVRRELYEKIDEFK